MKKRNKENLEDLLVVMIIAFWIVSAVALYRHDYLLGILFGLFYVGNIWAIKTRIK